MWNGELNALGNLPPEIVEVILNHKECQKSRAGILPMLLNDHDQQPFDQRKVVDYSLNPTTRRDDVDDHRSDGQMDTVRISVESVKRKTKRRAQEATTTSVVQRALVDEHIEIDHEQNNVSPIPFFCNTNTVNSEVCAEQGRRCSHIRLRSVRIALCMNLYLAHFVSEYLFRMTAFIVRAQSVCASQPVKHKVVRKYSHFRIADF